MIDAAQHWRELASEQRNWAAYLEQRGEFAQVARNKAQTYEDTAKSLDLGAVLGEPFCVCHLKPLRVMREVHAHRPVRR